MNRSRILIACVGLLAWCSSAWSEPKIIGKTETNVRIVRGGRDSAADPAPAPGVAPGSAGEVPPASPEAKAARAALEEARAMTAPRAGRDADATALARQLVQGYGGPRALEAWLDGGERAGLMSVIRPAEVEGAFTTRQRGDRMRLDLKTSAFGITVVLSPEGGWQNMLGLISDVAEEQKEELAVARAHDESLLLDAAAGRAPAASLRVEGGDALVVWGPRGDPTVFLKGPGSDRVVASAFRDRSSLRGVEVEHVLELSDWRALAPGTQDARGPAGSFAPFEQRHAMDGLPVERIRFTRIDLLAAIDDTVFARPGETKLVLGDARKVTLPLERHGGHHFAWIGINGGPPRLFLVDTGAGLTAISHDLADSLGIPLGDPAGIVALGGGVGARSATLRSVAMGSIERRDVSCVVMDFGELRTGLGAKMDGILGFSALNRLSVTFDFEHDALVLVQGGPATSPGAGGARVRFQSMGGQITVPGRLEGGAEFPLILDTGAGITFVPEEAARGVGGAVRVPGIQYVGVDGRPLEGEALRARSLSIGSMRIDRPIVVTADNDGSDDPTGITLGSGNRGVLGSNVLRRLKLTIDYPRGEIVLVPIPKPPEDDGGLVGPGVVLAEYEGDLVVRAVIAESPAARAGVAVGDRVTAIDRRDTSGLAAIAGGAQLFGAEGTSVELALRSKGGKERTVRMTRAPLL